MTVVLVDTNVLVYAHDLNQFEKQLRAIQVLQHLEASENGCMSVQCLAEFFAVTARGSSPKLSVDEAAQQVARFIQSWRVLDLTPHIVLEALRGVRDLQLSYWDAQIWATAKLNQIPVVFSEDLPSTGVLEGVRFVNPFSLDFVLDDWV
jgi:predicted nucleic acid-binding protein